MQAAVNQARRNHQKMSAVEFHRFLPGQLVGRGAVEQEQQFKTLVRVPRDAAGDVAADPADVNEHRQLDLIPMNIDGFLFHVSGTTQWARYLPHSKLSNRQCWKTVLGREVKII